MSSNRIPRNSSRMDVEFLIETSAHSRFMSAKKTDHGWVGTNEIGKEYLLPLAMLRNSEVCKLTNII